MDSFLTQLADFSYCTPNFTKDIVDTFEQDLYSDTFSHFCVTHIKMQNTQNLSKGTYRHILV